MKICHVNLASGFSGGERQTLQLIKQQLTEGYELTVVANPSSAFAKEVAQLPCSLVLASHFTRQHHRAVTSQCQLIHVHEGRAIYWALIQHLLYRTPYVVTRRIDNPLKKKWLSNLAYNKASAVIGLSQEIVNQIKRRHPEQNVFKIPSSPVRYPIDQSEVAKIRTSFSEKFLVIQAANMLKHKGFNLTIDAAKQLQAGYPNCHFILLGDGPEKPTLEKQAEQASNISFMGKQTNMGDWFAAADLLIHPSYSEGLGSVILEGMSAKLPVIGAEAGGIPDIIVHQASGLLFESGNSQSLAAAIEQVISNDPLRQQLISGGQERLKAFDIGYTSQQYADIYRTHDTEASL